MFFTNVPKTFLEPFTSNHTYFLKILEQNNKTVKILKNYRIDLDFVDTLP